MVVGVEHKARAGVQPPIEVGLSLPAIASAAGRYLKSHLVPHFNWKLHTARKRRAGQTGERDRERNKERGSRSHTTTNVKLNPEIEASVLAL